jgi:hypothetical protein
MDLIEYSKEYELDGSGYPSTFQSDIENNIPSIIASHYDDMYPNLAAYIEDQPKRTLLPYYQITYNDPKIEPGRYGELTILTTSVTIKFDINGFIRKFNLQTLYA